MSDHIRVLHFLNPFFAGIGGEESNYMAPRVEAGARGPGSRISQLLANDGELVATIVIGDNYFAENQLQSREAVCAAASDHHANVLVAGPAFNAGRYGLACGAACEAVARQLGIVAVTGMFSENPGVDFRRRGVYIVPTGDSARTMGDALPRIVALSVKLARGESLRPAAEEGYLGRGIRINERLPQSSAMRAVDMLLRKLHDEAVESEIVLEAQEVVAPPPPLRDLKDAVIALATETGLIPHSNPDRIPSARSRVWGKYSVVDLKGLTSDQFSFVHGGYDTTKVNQDPNRGVPLDALRDLEDSGVIKQVVNEVVSTCGNGGSLLEMKRIGHEMAQEAQLQGATAVILPAT
jgi:betaine reductase